MTHATAGRLHLSIRSRACLGMVLALTLLSAATPHASLAQGSGPASLTSIASSASPDGKTRLLLSFNRILPQFSIVTNDNERPVIGFADTVRGAGATIPAGEHGLLKAVEFNQRDSVLTMSFVGAQPLHVSAAAIAGRGLSVTIEPASRASEGAATSASGAGVAQFAERPTGEDEFEVVPLKYADISEVVGLLSGGPAIKPNDTFTPQEPAFGSGGLTGGNGTGANNLVSTYNPNGQDASTASLGQMVDDSIGVDRRLNAIILRGPPDRIARLKAKIAELDVPVQSVVLETVFVELTETGARNVGLDFNNSSGQLGVATFQRGSYLVNSAGGSGIDVAGYGSYSLQAAIYAQVQKGEGRIVSKPRISAQSGSSAKIITGDALPILTSIALSGVNAVSQQVQYVNVGVTLQIAPRVSADGYVTSHVFAEVSSVTGFSQGYPTISQREASTSATVKDGDYFVIGGLTQENKLVTKSKIPGLGDVPLVGELFKLHQESRSKTQLYIVVTPHIVRGEDAAEGRAEAERGDVSAKNPS